MRQMTTEKLFDEGKYMVIYLSPESVKLDERMFFLWTKEDQQEMEASYPRDDLVTRMIGGYCDEGALGMPLSVQLVARPYCDEVVLKLLSLLGTDTAN